MSETGILQIAGIAISVLALVLWWFIRERLSLGGKKFVNHEHKIERLEAGHWEQKTEVQKLSSEFLPLAKRFDEYISNHRKEHDKLDGMIDRLDKGLFTVQSKLDAMQNLLKSLVEIKD